MAAKNVTGKEAPFSAETYPYTECREQHHWKPYDVTIDKKAQIVFRIQQCANCTMKKHTQLSIHNADYGQIIRAYYAQPPGYRIPGGITLDERGAIRMHNVLGEAKLKGGHRQ